jgi:hypothetical protein
MDNIQIINDDVVFTIFNEDGSIQGLPSGDQFIVLNSEGPQGVVGPTAADIEMPAGVALSALRAVRISAGLAFYVDNQTLSHAHTCIGLSFNAVAPNGAVVIKSSGFLEDTNFAFLVDKPIYIGANGTLTQTPPQAPAVFLLRVGVAVSATKFFIKIERPILL